MPEGQVSAARSEKPRQPADSLQSASRPGGRATFHDNRPEARNRGELAAAVANSPRVLRQSAFVDSVGNSPYVAAQRRRTAETFGGRSSGSPAQRKQGGVVQFEGDIYADARDLANPLRNLTDQMVTAADVDFYVELLKRFSRALIEEVRGVNAAAFTARNLRRARALLTFREAGGTHATILNALALAGDNDDQLDDGLAFLAAFEAIPRAGDLDAARWAEVYAFRAQLTNDLLRTNAVALAADAAGAALARAALARTAEFGFTESFVAHAEARATEHRDDHVAKGALKIQTDAAAARAKAVQDRRPEALDSLTRRQRADVDNGTNKTGVDGKPRATTVLAEKQQELAQQNDFPGIGLREQGELANLRDVVGPQKFDEKKAQYQQWFASVNFHRDAREALLVAKEDFPLAGRIVGAIVAAAATRALLLTSGLSTAQIGRLLTLAPTVLAALLAAGVTPVTCGAYAAGDATTALLGSLHAAGVAAAAIQNLVPLFDRVTPYLANPAELAHLIALLGVIAPAAVFSLCAAAPGPPIGRMALLVAIRQKAASVADLTSLLTVCSQLKWTHTLISNTLGPLGNATPLATLKSRVQAAHLARFDKTAQFTPWLNAVDALIGQGYLTIAAAGGWVRLGGLPLTDEKTYNVSVVGGALNDTFVVHFHPGAAAATVGQTEASKTHLKPERGGAVRYKTPDMLPNVRPLIELRP